MIKSDDCVYTTPDGTIDLRTLSYKDRPKYTNIRDSGSPVLTYTFNACFSYSTTDTCQNAAVCMTDATTQTTSMIARQAGRQFSYNQDSTIIYNDGSNIRVRVNLVCKPIESAQATRIDDFNYIIHIESKCGCPGQCVYTPEETPGGLTGGAIFLIILVSLLATYVIVSVLFLRFVKHEQGANLIPNRTFWSQIGSNAIHGIRFTFSKITRRNNTYDKV